jgi:glucose/arabinose dehydrogenase
MPERSVRTVRVLLAAALSCAAIVRPAAAADAPATVRSAVGALRVERLATLEYPWGLATLPDGRVLITEKPGRLRIWADGRLSEPVRGVPEVVYRGGKSEQGGLMDVAVDPDFETNRRIYLSFSEAAARQPADARNPPEPRFGGGVDTTDTIVRGGAVARAVLDGDRLADLRVIWRQVPKTAGRGHFGNRLVFGPDRHLYVTSGDRMRFDPAQRLGSNLGKVVRIATDGSTPRDNPFAGRSGARDEVFSLGHRNVLAAAFEPRTGRLWAFEMGPLGGDEANVVQAGRNYGWPVASEGAHYNNAPIPDHAQHPSFAAPVKTWTPVISPSGALFYDGPMFPAWRGDALVGSLSDKAIVRLKVDGPRIVDEERIGLQRRVRDLAQTRDGALLAITDDREGELLRLTPDRQAVR